MIERWMVAAVVVILLSLGLCFWIWMMDRDMRRRK